MNHRPSGSMCAACKHLDVRDCSSLPFKGMPVMKTDKDGTVVVKCVEFVHHKPGAKS